ncbi:MAG: hypothetical protein PUJ69_03035 [Porphyromonas somerae]|uniref:hypothetical protein n=1 Tax=Porphyromonas somerae TaxID=322095 RepID=UPI0026F225B8|nr:hypothetical protein [Porphyromonas somerae]MDD7557627.1 hypothetical protein [Porphyromonas somerae]MDY5816247.1 hypothetical protein [Porphyromonas somerae]
MNDDFTDLFNFDDAFESGAPDLELFNILNEGQEFEPRFIKAMELKHDIKWSLVGTPNNRCIKRFCFLPKVFLFGT